MRKPSNFDGFYSRYNRSARADGGADATVPTTTTTTDGKGKWTAESWAAFLAGLGSLFGSSLDGASKVINSSNNAKQLPVAGVQYMGLPASNNKALLWMLGGGAVLVLLVLLVVLRKK